jgi:hypothetical protein
MEKKIAALVVLGLAAGVLGAADKPADLPKPDAAGFVSLFNGKDLTNWDGLDGYWSVTRDGCISGHETLKNAKKTFLILHGLQPGDFELHFSYKFTSPDGDSGVQFRSQVVDPKEYVVAGYQADFDARADHAGNIWYEHPAFGETLAERGGKGVRFPGGGGEDTREPTARNDLKKFVKVGDWNDCVVVAKGNHITYAMNGHPMTELTDDGPRASKEGVIALQLNRGVPLEVLFKDIKIKLLDPPK